MLRISRDQLLYGFTADATSVARLSPGEPFTVETHDTSTGRIHQPSDVAKFVAVRDPRKVNPAAGPLWVEGAEPGDALVVEILAIRLSPRGWVRVLGGAGVLQDGMTEHGVVMVDVIPGPDGDTLDFGGKLRFPARPMVGVVGTAPAEGTVYTAHPGPNGSNIDLNVITVGSRVILPVHHAGALLGIGDIHAAMGDGEVSGTGIEIAGEVDAVVTLVKGAAPRRIRVETPTDWISTGQAISLDDAVREAVEEMTTFLMATLDLTRTEAFLLVSARGDVRIGQSARISGCDATAYVMVPKSINRA